MTKLGVAEYLQSLGLKNHGNTNKRVLFHYRPLLRLYRNEITSLFGRLKRDEGMFLDREDPDLFRTELDQLLTEFGPLIWPSPGQGPRDHLLKPAKRSRYTSDLVYPRDKDVMMKYLRNLILSKTVRSGTDFDALVAKSNREATLGDFQKPAVADHRRIPLSKTKPRYKSHSDSDSEDSIVDPTIRSRVRTSKTSSSFQVALRLFRKTSPDELPSLGPCCSYGTIFLNGEDNSAAYCLARIDQHTGTKCVYIEFHLPEDMTLEKRIRIDRDSKEADDTFEQVVTILRDARKFTREPSYRTVEVEIGTDV